eukprot:gb/GECG01006391.1/.p1 GENE.gb/GECG01006391.1/~~gb/GECG01006391.1/.p1  ORF type:complete len:757 (+),score=49.13 gb/GECG01006391.1/:1-2271(+)
MQSLIHIRLCNHSYGATWIQKLSSSVSCVCDSPSTRFLVQNFGRKTCQSFRRLKQLGEISSGVVFFDGFSTEFGRTTLFTSFSIRVYTGIVMSLSPTPSMSSTEERQSTMTRHLGDDLDDDIVKSMKQSPLTEEPTHSHDMPSSVATSAPYPAEEEEMDIPDFGAGAQNFTSHKGSQNTGSSTSENDGGSRAREPTTNDVTGQGEHRTDADSEQGNAGKTNTESTTTHASSEETGSTARNPSRRVTPRYNTVRVANQLVPQLQVYFQLCDQYKTQPHAAITIALQYRTKVTYLQLDSSFGAADMLPLAHILKYNKTINSLDFRRCQIGNYGAYVLGDVLRANDTVHYINLSDNDIGEHGAVALAKGLEHSKTVEKLLLRGNRIGVAGATALSRVICNTVSLTYLDVCNNSLRVYGVQQLLTALQIRRKARKQSREQERQMEDAIRGTQRGSTPSSRGVMHGAADRLIDVIRPDIEVKYNGNFIQHEVYNSIIHGTGLLFSILGSFPLLNKARSTGDPGHFFGVMFYIVGLTAMYLSSTLRHGLFFLENTSELFHQIDKTAIYVLIAGTYTPFLIVNLGHMWWSKLLLLIVWSLSITGIVISTTVGRQYSRARLILYLLMGWLGIIPLYAGKHCFHPEGMFLLCAGGLIYSLGVFFYLRERLFPSRTQGLWYILVVLASALHFFAVYFHTRRCVTEESANIPADHSLLGDLLPEETQYNTYSMDIGQWGLYVFSGMGNLVKSAMKWVYPDYAGHNPA